MFFLSPYDRARLRYAQWKEAIAASTHPYMDRIRHAREDSSNYLAHLRDDNLPHSARKRIFELWSLPESYLRELTHPTRDWQAAKNSQKHLVQNAFQDIPIPESAEDCNQEFLSEVSFITVLYFQLATKPTKKNLQQEGRILKSITKAMDNLDKAIASISEKPEWFYIQDALNNAYLDEKAAKGFPRNLTNSAENFFLTSRWMHRACQRIQNDSEILFKDYTAHGRETENRDKALIALASSYELCFNEKPTSANKRNQACFYNYAIGFLTITGWINGEDESKDRLTEDSIEKLIKKTIREYKAIREQHYQEWCS